MDDLRIEVCAFCVSLDDIVDVVGPWHGMLAIEELILSDLGLFPIKLVDWAEKVVLTSDGGGILGCSEAGKEKLV